ncbi:MAG TPA: HD domain-containing protein [Thermodesulfobacteriota bacterium]|nr:HD domain-containing protein [Thermodesulfobacteriota bacterium]
METIPTKEECLRLMKQHGMLEHIIHHSLEVARVALFLSLELNKKGQRIDIGLVEAASLLHDLTKTECLKTKEDHAKIGCQLLKEMGYERVGELVGQHIRLEKEGNSSAVSEEEIVNYADKRVMHDRIVPLEGRFNDLIERYGKHPSGRETLEQLKREIRRTEKKIFMILQIDPDALASRLEKEMRKF